MGAQTMYLGRWLSCCLAVWALVAVGMLTAGGCATVNPQSDFNQAAGIISERTGAHEVYDPQADELVDQKVDQLLAEGLSVDEAVCLALLNNRSLQSVFQTIGASRADLVQSGLLSNPSLSLTARFPEGGGRTDLVVGFGQQLVDLWQIPLRKKVAQAQLDAAVMEVADRAIILAADVRARCYELLALQRTEATVQDSLKLVEQSFQLAQHQFEVGASSQLDVNLARANTIDIRLELITLQRERRVAEAALARLLNLSGNAKAWRLVDSLPVPRPVGPDDPWLVLAMTQRLDARKAELEVRAAEAELTQEYLKIFPNVAAGFELERFERRALPDRKILADTARESIAAGALTAPTIQSRAEREVERRQIIDAVLGPTLEMTLPIWDQNQAQIAKAGFKAQQKRKEYEDLMDRVANEVQQTLVVVRNSYDQVRFYDDQALPQANLNVEASRQVYQAGQQSILVVIEAQESLIRRRRAYVKTVGEYAVATADLERAIAGRLPQSPATQPAASPP